MAHHDPLTNLPNRLLFGDRLRQAIARVKRGEAIALHYLDLDRFKPVNDGYGHAVGDAVLRAVAERLRTTARATDTVARLGGDEFVVVQVGMKSDTEAAALARRLLKALSAAYEIAGETIEIGASIGIALSPLNGEDPDELLRKADHALYRSKKQGRGSYAFFESGIEGRAEIGRPPLSIPNILAPIDSKDYLDLIR